MDPTFGRFLHFPEGKVSTFDSIGDGEVVLCEGITEIRRAAEDQMASDLKTQLGLAKKNKNRADIEMRPMVLISTLGIDQPTFDVVDPNPEFLTATDANILNNDSIHEMPVLRPETDSDQFTNSRTMLAPATIGDDPTGIEIGFFVGKKSKVADYLDLLDWTQQLYMSSQFNARIPLIDADISECKFRSAKLIGNSALVLNRLTNLYPGRDNIDFTILFDVSPSSKIRISADGSTVAVTQEAKSPYAVEKGQVCLFDTASAESTVVHQQAASAGEFFSTLEPSFTVPQDNQVTDFEFCDGNKMLLVGDNQGVLKLIDLESRETVSVKTVVGKPKRLTKQQVKNAGIVWIVFVLGILIARKYRDNLVKQAIAQFEAIPVA